MTSDQDVYEQFSLKEDDYYSLGLTIWELFVEEPPFRGKWGEEVDNALLSNKTDFSVDLDRIGDVEAKEIVRNYLTRGNAASPTRVIRIKNK